MTGTADEGPEHPFTLSARVPRPYAETVAAVRDALAEQGFGVLTEIDLAATLKAKLDVDIPAQVILGACRPALAYAALRADPSVAALLPCNVVVRAVDDGSCVVEAFDPAAMTSFSGSEVVRTVADDARQRLTDALAGLERDTHTPHPPSKES